MPSPALFNVLFGAGGGEAAVPAQCGSDLLASGAAWLAGRLRAHAAQPITYRRDEDAVVLCATFGRTLLRLADDLGTVRIEWTDRDFVIPAADLILADGPTLPRRGDIIEHDDGLTREVFEVLPYSDEPPWRYSDPFRQLIRVHVKRLSSE